VTLSPVSAVSFLVFFYPLSLQPTHITDPLPSMNNVNIIQDNSATLKLEAARSSETSLLINNHTQREKSANCYYNLCRFQAYLHYVAKVAYHLVVSVRLSALISSVPIILLRFDTGLTNSMEQSPF
jgi:hypothetical protein